ncbi:MAG: hypothetical protein JRG96_07355, partial [Deltaproteobacteria bacterium]|nr:hypothetical protein [Deltaproteobacteria bacterium]
MVPSRGSAGGGSGGTEPLAGDYAERLLADLAAEPVPAGEAAVGLHPDLEWARSGAMALTGYPDRAPLLAPAPLALCA